MSLNPIKRVSVHIRELQPPSPGTRVLNGFSSVRNSTSIKAPPKNNYIIKKNDSLTLAPDSPVRSYHVSPKPPFSPRSLHSKINAPFEIRPLIKKPAFYKPKEKGSLIVQSANDKENSFCLPYELSEPKRAKRVEIKKIPKRIISKPLAEIKIQRTNIQSENLNYINSNNNLNDTSRNPSFISNPRTRRFQELSKDYKIDKELFNSQVNKQRKTLSQCPSIERVVTNIRAHTPDFNYVNPFVEFIQELDIVSSENRPEKPSVFGRFKN